MVVKNWKKDIYQKIETFLNSNIDKIKTVIFTGDVFLNPSLKKWNKLENQFGSKIKIIVAPGIMM